MRILAIDTSTKYLGLAVADGGVILAEHQILLERKISSQLLPRIKKALGDLELSLGDIGAIAVSAGPGSFTGLRIGIATVKGLAFASKKPIAAVPTLDALAHNARYFPATICTIVDAKKSMVYSAVYVTGQRGLSLMSNYAVEPVEALLKKLNGRVLFIGDGIGLYRDIILKYKTIKPEFAPEELWYPKASVVGLLGLRMLKKGKTVKANELVPLYLHPKECTIKRRMVDGE